MENVKVVYRRGDGAFPESFALRNLATITLESWNTAEGPEYDLTITYEDSTEEYTWSELRGALKDTLLKEWETHQPEAFGE